MFHKRVPYTLRQGIERDQWTVTIHFPDREVQKRVQCSKQAASDIACDMIDKWLEKNRPQGGQISN